MNPWNVNCKKKFIYHLARLSKEESEQCEDNEIGPTRKIRELIHLKGSGDRKKDQLHADGDDGAHCQVVHIQNLNSHGVNNSDRCSILYPGKHPSCQFARIFASLFIKPPTSPRTNLAAHFISPRGFIIYRFSGDVSYRSIH